MTLKQAYKIMFNEDIEKLTESKVQKLIDKKELTRVYKKLISEFHPDLIKYKKGLDIQTMEIYSKEINEAYDILKKCLNPLYIHQGTYQESAFEKYLKDLEEKKKSYLRQQKERTEKLKKQAIEMLERAYKSFEYKIKYEDFQRTTQLYNDYLKMDLSELLIAVNNYKKESEKAKKIKHQQKKLYEKTLNEIERGNIDFDYLKKVIEELTSTCHNVFEDNIQYEKAINWLKDEELTEKFIKRRNTVLDSIKKSSLKKLELYKKSYINLRKEIVQREILNAIKEISNQINDREKLILSERLLLIVTIHNDELKECERKFEKYYHKINQLDPNKITINDIEEINSYFEELCQEYLNSCQILVDDPEKLEKLKNRLEDKQPSVEQSLIAIDKTYKLLRKTLINEIVVSCQDIIKNKHQQMIDGHVEIGYADLNRINKIDEIILLDGKKLSIDELLKLRDEIFYLVYDQDIKKKSPFLSEEEKSEIIAEEKCLEKDKENIKQKYEYFIIYYKYLKKVSIPTEITKLYNKYLNNQNNSNIITNCSKKLNMYYNSLEDKVKFNSEQRKELIEDLIEGIDTYIVFYRGINGDKRREEYYNLTWYNSKENLEGLTLIELYNVYKRAERMYEDDLKNIPPIDNIPHHR